MKNIKRLLKGVAPGLEAHYLQQFKLIIRNIAKLLNWLKGGRLLTTLVTVKAVVFTVIIINIQ